MSKNQKLTDKEILAHYIKMGEALSEMFKPNLEVIIHDLRFPEHSIIAIFNSQVTGRKVGEGTSDLGYKKVEGKVPDKVINYKNKMSDFNIDFSSSKVNYINDFSEDWKVNLIDTGKNTMTGGRLLRLKPYLEKEEMFMLTYGDGVSNIDINKLANFHKSHGKIGTMSVVRPHVRFGEVFNDSGLVTSFQEKPQAQSGWINGGFFVFSPKIFDYIENDTIMLERQPLEKLVEDQQLMSYEHEGFWQCMDTIRDRDLLIDKWNSGNAKWLK